MEREDVGQRNCGVSVWSNMEGTKWNFPWGQKMMSVKREKAGESFDDEYEMQEQWEPLVRQVKQEQPCMETDTGATCERQFMPDTSMKYDTESWDQDSDSGIVEECPSEFISSKLLKEDGSELESDSGISEEYTAQPRCQPDHIQSPHEIFLEEEIMWHFTEDPCSARDPLSTEEEQQQEMPLEVTIKDEEQDEEGGAGAEGQYDDFQTKGGELPPPFWGPHFLDSPPPDEPLDGYATPHPADPPPGGYAASHPGDPTREGFAAPRPTDLPPEGYTAPPLPPADYWDRRPHLLPRTQYCSVCVRWFTSVPHLKRHFASAHHIRLALAKGQPVVPSHLQPRRSRSASLESFPALGDVDSSSDGSRGDGGKLPELRSRTSPPPKLPPQPPLPPPSDVRQAVRKSSRSQACSPTPQLPAAPHVAPDGTRAPPYVLQPFHPYEYERRQQPVPGSFQSQLCRTPRVPDGPEHGFTSQMRRDAMHLQEQQQQYLYQQQLYEQHEKWRLIREEARRRHLHRQWQRQLTYPHQSGDASRSLSPLATSAPRSAVTAIPESSSIGGTAGNTAPSFPLNENTYRNGRQDAYRILPHTVSEKNFHGTTVHSQRQPGTPSAPQSMPVTAGRHGRGAGVLSRRVEKLQSQYPEITICAPTWKPPPPPTSAFTTTAVTSKPAPPPTSAFTVTAITSKPSLPPTSACTVTAVTSKLSPPPTSAFTATVVSPDVSAGLTPECPVCGVTFAHESSLRRHIDFLHSGLAYFKCESCGAVLAGIAAYRSHVAEHGTGVDAGKPHPCDECSKRFTNRAHLMRHKMLHSGKRPHVCHVCSKGFSRKDHMLKHTKVHACRCSLCISGAAYTNLLSEVFVAPV